jgi:hypothetical protein
MKVVARLRKGVQPHVALKLSHEVIEDVKF